MPHAASGTWAYASWLKEYGETLYTEADGRNVRHVRQNRDPLALHSAGISNNQRKNLKRQEKARLAALTAAAAPTAQFADADRIVDVTDTEPVPATGADAENASNSSDASSAEGGGGRITFANLMAEAFSNPVVFSFPDDTSHAGSMAWALTEHYDQALIDRLAASRDAKGTSIVFEALREELFVEQIALRHAE